MLIGSDNIPDQTCLRADVCIVGAGAAGLAMAVEMDGRGLDVIMLDKGGLDPEPDSDDNVEYSGLPRWETEPRRQFGVGGTTNSWYGRLARFDAIDFEARPWVPLSGWPIARDEVLRYELRAAQFFGLPRNEPLEETFWQEDSDFRSLAGPQLRPAMHVWPRSIDTARQHLPRLRRSPNVRIILQASGERLLTSASAGKVSSLVARGATGHTFTIAARHYVLAAGGWENPRLLLLSTNRDGNALGNRHDTVGRYYMNHPRLDGAAQLHLDDIDARYRDFIERRRRDLRTQPCVSVDPQLQRDEQLLNGCSFLYPAAVPIKPRALPRISWHVLTRRSLPIRHLALVDQAEQTPDPNSYVRLSDHCDPFGNPLLEVHWLVGEDTTRSLRRLHQLIDAHFRAVGAGRLESKLFDPTYQPRYLDAAHPMGATRMSVDPRYGVVDADCRVHGVDNLHIAGSSVFPTSGQGPPTLTIVCLALRLAEHLLRR